MGVIIAVASVAWAWYRMGRQGAGGEIAGLGAVAFWAVFGVVLAFGSFTSLFIILLPVGVVLLLLSRQVEPARSWLALAGLVAIPTIWLAAGAIDAGTGGWVAALVSWALVGLVAVAFETRQRRLSKP
ncbi:MAG: hypothetical protein M3378_09310 [Actinomycetota bacterium]|nr:hypothetical protein [Actinomycetota bacterium]MDQ3680717.1 hypothetical protein [Actinomycetota bacterium]